MASTKFVEHIMTRDKAIEESIKYSPVEVDTDSISVATTEGGKPRIAIAGSLHKVSSDARTVFEDSFGTKLATFADFSGTDAESVINSVCRSNLKKNIGDRMMMVFSVQEDEEGIYQAGKNIISTREVIERVFNKYKTLQVKAISPYRGATEIRMIDESLQREPELRVGDISVAGVNLFVGKELRVEPFVYRLVCENGLTTNVGKFEAELGSFEGFDGALELSMKHMKEWQTTASQKVDNPRAVVTRIAQQADLPARHIARLHEAWTAEQDNQIQTTYDVVNYISSFWREGRAFERAGFRAIHYAQGKRCASCGTSVN